MMELGSLYQELILDHNAAPRNFGKMEQATHCVEGVNPLCGDNLVLYLRVKGDVIEDVRFQGSGCAISQASTSLMTTALKGKTVAEATQMFEAFRDLVTAETSDAELATKLGKLAAFEGVKQFPSRVKCATLGWHTLKAALDGERDMVSTE